MNKKWISLILCLALSGAPAWAQRDEASSSTATGPQRHLSTIVFSGVAGAILGLSTLSFYGRPQEKLSHIAIGAAIGIIGGAMFTTFRAATEPRDFYGLREQGPNPELWAENMRGEDTYTPRAGYTFEF